MYSSDVIINNIKKSRLYGVNNPNTIKKILHIPDYVDLKKLDRIIDDCYDFYYVEKSSCLKVQNKDNIKEECINTDKTIVKKYKEIPNDKANNYRRITSIKRTWLKTSLQILNRILVNILLTNDKYIKDKISCIPYLHSSVKKRSYFTNAISHIGDKNVLCIDLKDFFPSIDRYRIFLFFKNYFNISSDIAMIYAVLSTCKDSDGIYKLAQGLPQSSTLAFLVNFKSFDYIYNLSIQNDIDMTLYVDDVIFSSNNEISQSFINRLFGIFKRNGLFIKRKKVKHFNNQSVKKITGVYINGNKSTVSNLKHYVINIQYMELLRLIKEMKSFDDYFKIYNLYLKFYGNYQFISLVEGKKESKFSFFVNDFDSFFPKGIKKKDKSFSYSSNNVLSINDICKLNSSYQLLKNKCKIQIKIPH